MPLNDGTETAELHESNAFEIQSLRTTYKAALELIEELDVINAVVLEALTAIMDSVDAGKVRLDIYEFELANEAIRKASQGECHAKRLEAAW